MRTEATIVFETRLALLREKLVAERDLLSKISAPKTKPFAQKVHAEIVKRLNELDDLAKGTTQNGQGLPQKRFAEIERRSQGLFGECLALRLAEYTRNSVGEEVCDIADRLLAELVSAVAFDTPQFTTVADAEFVGRSSRIIRLRYPATSLWDLPVLGHEFGHSFGPHWYVPESQEPYPREFFLRMSSLGSKSVIDEYFCDLFATFVLGPSYPAMCVLERFDPTGTVDDEVHPADTKRAWWVLRALELIAESGDDPDETVELKSMAERLRRIWTEFTAQCGGVLPDQETALLELALQKMIGLMRQGLPSAAYGALSSAWGLVADFKDSKESAPGEVSLRDLLNASWFLRIESLTQQERVEAIGEWAWGMARNMVCQQY